MSEPLRILEALGEELERATAADERAAAGRRWWRPHGLPLIALLLGLTITSVAAAATHLFGLAAPVNAPRPGEAPPEAQPVAATMRLAGVPAADPAGLPSWDVRVSRSRTGEICTAVGQVVDGRFGIVGLDHRFRELPLGSADACGERPASGDVQVGARAAVGRGDMTPRTLIVGVAGAEVRRVALLRDGVTTPLALGRGRAFVAALEGLPELVHPKIQVTTENGRTRVIRLADSGRPETPDPDGGAPWMIDTHSPAGFVLRRLKGYQAPPAGLRCMRGIRQGDSRAVETGGALDPAKTPIVCRSAGQTEPIVATLRRMSPQGGREPQDGYFYGLNPARTIAAGLVSADVERLELVTPTGAVPVTITPGRAFLAVLDGRTDPTRLELRARLRGGGLASQRVENARLLALTGRTIHPAVAPPYLDLASTIRTALADREPDKVPGSTVTGPRVTDPAGGPDWVASAWARRVDGPQSGFGDVLDIGKPRELSCALFGPTVDGQLRSPHGREAGAGPPEAWFGDECTSTRLRPWMKDRRFHDRAYGLYPNATIYVDDPSIPQPQIVRVSLSGVFPGIERAEVLGVPGRKAVPATVGPRGATLALLGPAAAKPGVILRFRLHYPGGRVAKTDYQFFSPAPRKPAARAVDPKGGAGWSVGLATGFGKGVPSSPGQLIDGRLGQINDRTGALFLTQGITFDPGARRLSAANPVTFQQQVYPDRSDSPDSLSPADIARRTLPGRTVIYGSAAPGVTRVTLRTPRDVRTLRPSKPGGVFLAVYDGRFTQGEITTVASGPGIHGETSRPADPFGR